MYVKGTVSGLLGIGLGARVVPGEQPASASTGRVGTKCDKGVGFDELV
jgi:hypothetical protein